MAQKRGNSYKLTEATAKRILNSIRAGNYMEVAAGAAGISKVTLLDWLRRGARGGSPKHAKLAADFAQAELQAEEMAVGHITMAAMKGIWQAAAWRLERKHPDRWGRRDKIEHLGAGGGPVQTQDVTRLTTGERRARLAALTATAKARAASLAALAATAETEAADDGEVVEEDADS